MEADVEASTFSVNAEGNYTDSLSRVFTGIGPACRLSWSSSENKERRG